MRGAAQAQEQVIFETAVAAILSTLVDILPKPMLDLVLIGHEAFPRTPPPLARARLRRRRAER